MSLDNRPRERLEQEGPKSLSTAELLAIVLKSGTKKENVLEISNKLLAKFGKEGLIHCSLPELVNEYGIGKAKACQIVALCEFAQRLSPNNLKTSIKKAEDVAQIYLPRLQHLQQEHFIAVYLDTKNKVISDQVLTIGTINASLIHPREVFHGAIKNLASSVIVIHNHPTGDSKPSKEDLEITNILHQTGKMIGISLLDHLIIGKNEWWSWKESEKHI